VFNVVCILYKAREADKIGKKFKKILMFVGSTNISMFIGEPMIIRPTWHQGWRRPTWHTFIGQVEPTNVRVLGSSVPPGRQT
jgi:hypothetical protein